MDRVKILYVEDDLTAAQYLTEFLEEYGFEVKHTDSLSSALSFLNMEPFDLVLLDLALPDFDGFELFKSANDSKIPVIVISAFSDTNTKVKAFRYGACDYLVKPIDLVELEARIWAHLRHFGKATGNEEKEQPLFCIEDNQVRFQNQIIDFTPVEFEIFSILLQNKNRTITRERLTEALSSVSSHRTLDYHIKNIRSKIEDDSKNPKYLKTEYGIGYKLVF